MKETFVLIDGNSLLNRAYYAIPPLNSAEGKNVNAVYGFINILLKVLSEIKPRYLAIAFDRRGKNFRHQIYSQYKATRKGMPDDLALQMPILFEILDEMKIRRYGELGVEADDVIGTIAKKFNEKFIVVSGDRDLLQLVDNNIDVWLTKKGITEVEVVTEKNIKELYELSPNQIVDYKALRGDPSDNIPGVSGIGEKTAINLIKEYSSLENIYKNVDEIKGALLEKLVNGKDDAFMSKMLAEIKIDVEFECKLDDCFVTPFSHKVRDLFEKYEFRSLYKRLGEFLATDVKITHADEVPVSKVLVSNLEGLKSLADNMSKAEKIAIHLDRNLFIASKQDEEFEVEISDNLLDGLRFDTVIDVLKPLFESKIKKVVYDGKALRHQFEKFNVKINDIVFDISLMQYLVEYRSFKDFSSLKIAYNLTSNAAALFVLSQVLESKLQKDKTDKLYFETELPLSDVLFEMEKEGCKIDIEVLEELHEKYIREIERLTEDAYLSAGEKFNVLSSKQLSNILFDKLKLPHDKKTKTGYSTDIDVLEKLQKFHPLPGIIISIRKVSKLDSTYIEGIRPFICQGNKIHTTFNQALTATGRLSSSEPNLQNLPMRDDEGRELRKMFIPSNDIFISADYSQIELRLLANFSGDKNLIAAFNAGKDIHSIVASEIFGVPEELVNANMRRMAKAVNFGIIYGISDFGLSQNIGTTPTKAKEYISKYFSSYPKIKNYLDESIKFAKENGYICTILGRRRYIPELKSENFQIRSFGERAAMNMPLQGSAADIIKVAMLNVSKALKTKNMKSKLMLQIHDELIIDAIISEKEEVENLLEKEMTKGFDFSVKMDINIESGVNLYEAK